MWNLIVIWFATALSLLIVAWLPLGVEISGFGRSLVAAAVFGVLNVLVKPILQILALPLTVLTLGLFWFVVNAAVFALAAAMVDGFTLKHGFWSALAGSIALSLINSVITGLIGVNN